MSVYAYVVVFFSPPTCRTYYLLFESEQYVSELHQHYGV